MSRSKIREQIFKMIFQVEFYNKEELEDQMKIFLEHEEEQKEEDMEYIEGRVADILSKLSEIDEIINAHVTGWNTGRMGKVDLSIIRLAVYEMKFDSDIPVGVAINEAVELAKKYGTDDSQSFVNGVLAKIPC